jgi:predicted nucleic acid-binding protein
MITIDANVLIYLIDPAASAPTDPATGQQVSRCRDRLECLILDLTARGTKLLLPTPAVTEVLVRTGTSAARYLEEMRRMSVFRIVDFDQRAALECATIMGRHWDGKLRELSKEVGKHRIKFDLQIVAVSKVHRSAEILSDDPGVKKLADLLGVPCRGIADLPLPADPAQAEMFSDL